MGEGQIVLDVGQVSYQDREELLDAWELETSISEKNRKWVRTTWLRGQVSILLKVSTYRRLRGE